MKYYGRYMDDFYIMAEDIATLDELTQKIREQCEKYKLFLSDKKIRTCRMDKEFVYLKTIYRVEANGHIVKRMHHSAVERERRRLKKHKGLINRGRMTFNDVRDGYRGWRGCYKRTDSRRQIEKMDKYFYELFGRQWYDTG